MSGLIGQLRSETSGIPGLANNMDMGLYTETSLSTSDNMRRRLENIGLNEGTIATLNQNDTFEKDGLTIRIIPAHDFF
jgi:hypothetical protein